MIADRIRRPIFSDCELPYGSSVQCERPGWTLITEEPWDSYHLESLLPLRETYRENTNFGFLLRHYWMPASILQFRRSSRLTLPGGGVDWAELEIERKIVRCCSSVCVWREKTCAVAAASGNAAHVAANEMLCSYDCYEQTYVSAKPVLFVPPSPERKEKNRQEALCRLPILCPAGPVPVGFSWYGKVGGDYMNYRLDAEERVGETSVLVVRREGRCTQLVPDESARPDCETKTAAVVTQRQGVTLLAWNRGAVLEDRFMDCIVEADACLASTVGTTNQVVTRLVRSCPIREPVPCQQLGCRTS